MLLITDVTALTIDRSRRIVREAAIAIEGDHIVEVAKQADLIRRYPMADRLDGCGAIALPGLIDAHAHSPQALLRSVADDVGWRPYLEEFIWPLQAHYSPEDALASLRLCMLEMVKSGTTCFVDPLVVTRYDFDGLAKAVADSGMRAVLAKMVMDRASVAEQSGVIDERMVETEEGSLREAERAIKTWHGSAGGRLQVWYGPRVPREPVTACSPDFYRRVAGLAEQFGVGITVHLAGEREDLGFFEREYGTGPVGFLEHQGLLRARVLVAMGCWIPKSEFPLLASSGTAVAHCPSANMKLASGVASITAMRAAGVTVALGCDSGANNNCYDMVRELKAASMLQAISTMDAGALPAEAVLEMATIEGAKAIGRDSDLGSLEPGKQADIVLVNLRQAHTMPVFDPVANLVFAAHGGDVDTVLVAGRVIMRHRKVLTMDEEEVLAEAQRRGDAVLSRAGISVRGAWPVE